MNDVPGRGYCTGKGPEAGMSLEAPEEQRGGWGEGRVVGDVQRKAKTDHEGL